jgi:hypothetical protein
VTAGPVRGRAGKGGALAGAQLGPVMAPHRAGRDLEEATVASTTSLSVGERQILARVSRLIGGPERELRYQLERKDDHPLARREELLDVLAELEDRGLVVSELHFRLTEAGHAALDAAADA